MYLSYGATACSSQTVSMNMTSFRMSTFEHGRRFGHLSRSVKKDNEREEIRIICNSARRRAFSTLPHCRGQWVVEGVQYTAALQGDVGSGASSVAAALQRAMGNGRPSVHCRTSVGCGQWKACSTPPHCSGQWVVEGLQCTAALKGLR